MSPISAPSGGKSTIAQKLSEIYENDFYKIGLDDLRLKIFCENFPKVCKGNLTDVYKKAFKYIIENKIDIEKLLIQKIKENLNKKVIYVDNTNATYKSRRKILNSVEKERYKVGIFIFSVTLNEIFKRNEKREIKINKSAIRQIYNTISFPSLIEFDEIIVL